MSEPGPPLRLVSVDAQTAAALDRGAAPAALPDGLTPGDGWPDEGSATSLELAARAGWWTWLIVVDGDEVIGTCGSKGPPGETGDLEIGYGLAEPYRGRGLGTAAVTALLEALRPTPGLRRVVAATALDNEPSRRLLTTLGFGLVETDDEEARYAVQV